VVLHSMWFWAASGFAGVLIVSLVPGVGPFVLAPVAALVTGILAAWYMRSPDVSAGTVGGLLTALFTGHKPRGSPRAVAG